MPEIAGIRIKVGRVCVSAATKLDTWVYRIPVTSCLLVDAFVIILQQWISIVGNMYLAMARSGSWRGCAK